VIYHLFCLTNTLINHEHDKSGPYREKCVIVERSL
jgi:hypothetical protein